MDLFSITAHAAGEAAKAGSASQAGAGSMLSMMLPFIIIVVVMYFVAIRPQKKQEKQKKEMLSQLIVGDQIATIGGIHGKIVSIKGDFLFIETGSKDGKSTLKIARWAVGEVTKPGKEVPESVAEEVNEAESEE